VSVKVLDNDMLLFRFPSGKLAGQMVWLPVGCIGIFEERAKTHDWYKRTRALDTDDLHCFELFFHRSPTKLMWIQDFCLGIWSEVAL
jgi:hypothetical protein